MKTDNYVLSQLESAAYLGKPIVQLEREVENTMLLSGLVKIMSRIAIILLILSTIWIVIKGSAIWVLIIAGISAVGTVAFLISSRKLAFTGAKKILAAKFAYNSFQGWSRFHGEHFSMVSNEDLLNNELTGAIRKNVALRIVDILGLDLSDAADIVVNYFKPNLSNGALTKSELNDFYADQIKLYNKMNEEFRVYLQALAIKLT